MKHIIQWTMNEESFSDQYHWRTRRCEVSAVAPADTCKWEHWELYKWQTPQRHSGLAAEEVSGWRNSASPHMLLHLQRGGDLVTMLREPVFIWSDCGGNFPTMLSKKAPRRCQSFLSLRKVIMWERRTSLAFCLPKNTQRRVMPFSINVCLTMFSGSLSKVTTFCWTISCKACSSLDNGWMISTAF